MITDTIDDVDFTVLERLEEKLAVNSDRALSIKLGLSHAGIAMARRKNTLPYGPIVSTCAKHNISLDYIFGISPIEIDEVNKTSSEHAQPILGVDDLLAANALVEKVLEELLYTKNLPAERELLICKKLRPMLIQKAFEHNMNEVFVKTVAEGALYMA